MSQTTLLRLLLLTGLVGLALFPAFGGSFYVQLLTRVMILAILAMSLDLLIGYTGLISFGHAAYYGIGAYTLAATFQDATEISLWTSLPLSIAASAAVAAILGAIVVRTSGIYFIMITLAFAQMVFYFFFESRWFGGDDGIFLYFKPTLELAGWNPVDLDSRTGFYYFVLALLAGVYLLLRTVLHSPFGQVIQAIRVNEARVQALGYATGRYKLVAFTIAGGVAGLAGYLQAANSGFVNPSYLSWHTSGILMVMVILGGMGRLYGAVIGAFMILLLEDFLPDLTDHWHLALGAIIIAVVLFLPHGVGGLLERCTARAARGDA